MCNLPFTKSRSRPDRSQRKAKLHKRIVSTNYAVPTGNLDVDTAAGIVKIFKELAHEDKKCVIAVTHSEAFAAEADVVVRLEKKKLQD